MASVITFPPLTSVSVGYTVTSGNRSWQSTGDRWAAVSPAISAYNVVIAPGGNLSGSNVQSALSSLDIRITTLSTAGGIATAATAVTIVNTGNLSGSNVQSALSGLDVRITTLSTVPGSIVAKNVYITVSGNLSGSNVQSALSGLDVRITTLSAAGSPATTATAVTIVNTGNLSGSNVQSALSGLDARVTALSTVQGSLSAKNISIITTGNLSGSNVQSALSGLDVRITTLSGSSISPSFVNTKFLPLSGGVVTALTTFLSAISATGALSAYSALIGNASAPAVSAHLAPLTIVGNSYQSVFTSIQNLTPGVSASTDISLYNDTSVNCVDIGINSSTYNGNLYTPKFNIVNPNDAYLFTNGISSGLAIGTALSAADVLFFTNGTLSGTSSLGGNERMRIKSAGNIGVGVSLPNKEFTVQGSVSASSVVYDSTGNSTLWNNAATTVQSNSAAWGGGGTTWVTKTTSYNLVAGNNIFADTSAAPFTMTLPASSTSSLYDTIVIADKYSTWSINNLTISGNGATTIANLTGSLVCDVSNKKITLMYNSKTWNVYI